MLGECTKAALSGIDLTHAIVCKAGRREGRWPTICQKRDGQALRLLTGLWRTALVHGTNELPG